MNTGLQTGFCLAGYATAIAVPVANVYGKMAALYNGSVFDRVLSSSTLAAIFFQEFFIAYIRTLLFAEGLGWLPSLVDVVADTALVERLYKTLLPAVTLTLIVLA